MKRQDKTVSKAYDNPCGYTISTGCDIPIGTSLENMDFLMELPDTMEKRLLM